MITSPQDSARQTGLSLAFVLPLIVGTLATSGARAGVEWVTPVGDCKVIVDKIGDGKPLRILAGTVQFEVWGDFVDWTDRVRGFDMTEDFGDASIRADIIEQRGGFENADRNCPFKGSAVVQFESPGDLSETNRRSIFFTMPFQDRSGLAISIKPFPSVDVTWSRANPGVNLDCIIGTGSRVIQVQDTVQRINLPPGHQQDQSSCFPTLNVEIQPDDVGPVDIVPLIEYSVTGLPNFITAQTLFIPSHFASGPPESDLSSTRGGRFQPNGVVLKIDTPGIRALGTRSESTITIGNPNRSDTLQLVVQPQLGNGFTTAATCTPDRFNVQDLTDCNIRLAPPAGGAGQPITWRMTTASCFTEAVTTAPYDPSAAFQIFDFPPGQTSANIRMRSVRTPSCGDEDGVVHLFEAWVGDFRADPQVTAASSGLTYTRAKIIVVQPPVQ